MNSDARNNIADLLELSAHATGYQWMAVVADQSPEPVVYPPEAHGHIHPYLEARRDFLIHAADEPIDLETLISATGAGTDPADGAGFQPGFFMVMGLFDKCGKRQGSLVVLDSSPRQLNHEQKSAITRIARLTERHIDAGAIEKANQERFENSLKLNRAILDTLHNAVVTTDIRGKIRTVNPALEAMFGYPEASLIGTSINKLMPPEVAAHHDAYLKAYAERQAGSGKIIGFPRNLQGIRSDGSRFPLRIAVTETTVDYQRLLIAAIYDITRSEEDRADLEHFRNTLDSTHDCVFMFDADELKFFYVNRGAVNQLGYDREELMTMHPFDILPGYPEARFRQLVSPLKSGEVTRLSFQTLHRHKDGHAIPIDVGLQYVQLGVEPPRFLAIARDISEQHQHRAEVEKLAFFDPLTNLPNRRLIKQRLEESVTICAKSGCFGAILLSDLDDFKNINDTIGHRHGDDFLVEISRHFSEALGKDKTLARLGGDEFLVVFNTFQHDRKSANEQVTKTARQLMEAARKASGTTEVSLPVSTSIGIALYNDASLSATELMRMADIAMYDAKSKGKSNFSIFDEQMQQSLLDDHNVTADLNIALGRDNEIVPWFQPKVDHEGRFTGFEALVRWNHPQRGLLNPGDFIDLAERKNLIVPMSDHVLRHACRQMHAWRQCFAIADWTVSVNISQSQLAMRDFPEKIAGILAETGLPARALILEITETVVAEDILHSIRQMELIRAAGVHFSLDDFGTGYSSLSYLRQLPINELKIDKSFVDTILHDEEGEAIIKAILTLSQSLKLSVVAEGIEEQEQWQRLKGMGCEYFQGYLFSRPRSAEQIPQDLRKLGLAVGT